MAHPFLGFRTVLLEEERVTAAHRPKKSEADKEGMLPMLSARHVPGLYVRCVCTLAGCA